jgi:SAM-dependent methyltransferase
LYGKQRVLRLAGVMPPGGTGHGATKGLRMDAARTCAYYATIAPFYDAELATRDDLPCWLTLFDAWKPRRSLEYGCGTGRLAVPLALRCARWGGDIAGVDLSPVMLEWAIRRWRRERGDAPPAALHFYRGDMRRVTLDHAVDLAIFADDPLTHLSGAADLAATFRGAGRHLRPGGRLVVEASLLPPEARGQARPVLVRQRYDVPSPAGRIAVEQERWIDAPRDRATVAYRYRLADADGERKETVTEAHFTAHYLDLASLEALFQLAGCRLEERWCDFQFHTVNEEAAMVLCTGTKR